MPYKSVAQQKYFHANRKRLEAEGVDVGEWDDVTDFKKLPRKIIKKLLGKGETEKTAFELPSWALPAGGALAGGYLAKQYRDSQDPEDTGWGLPLLGAAVGAGMGLVGNWGLGALKAKQDAAALEHLRGQATQAGMQPDQYGHGASAEGRFYRNDQLQGAMDGKAPLNPGPDQEGFYAVQGGKRPGSVTRWKPTEGGLGQLHANAQQASRLGLNDVADKQVQAGQAIQDDITAKQQAFMAREKAFAAKYPGYTADPRTTEIAAGK